jgi:hypothetical protein
MDLRRLRAGEWVAAVGGGVLMISLFFSWYRADGIVHRYEESIEVFSTPRAHTGFTAWEAFAAVDIVLAVVAVAAAALLMLTATQRVPAVPVAFAALLTLLGMAAVVLVLVRAAWIPDIAEERAWALWLGLAGAVGVAAGGWLAMRDERLSRPGRPTDAAGRPAPAAPEIRARRPPEPTS